MATFNERTRFCSDCGEVISEVEMRVGNLVRICRTCYRLRSVKTAVNEDLKRDDVNIFVHEERPDYDVHRSGV